MIPDDEFEDGPYRDMSNRRQLSQKDWMDIKKAHDDWTNGDQDDPVLRHHCRRLLTRRENVEHLELWDEIHDEPNVDAIHSIYLHWC